MARYDVVDFQGLEGPVKKVRKALGARAFGVDNGGRYEPPEWG